MNLRYQESCIYNLNYSTSGSSINLIANGLDYSRVFDPDYYLQNNPDVANAYGNNKQAAFNHFLSNGMAEARRSKSTFYVVNYRNRYPDLQAAFGNDWRQYYIHYINHGYAEGRIGY